MSLLRAFGHLIRYLRGKRNLSQEALALKSNLDRTYVSDIEKGKRNVSLLVLEKLAIGLEVEINELVEDL
jgi:transcriptional regulator with XRE-family HTH domain